MKRTICTAPVDSEIASQWFAFRVRPRHEKSSQLHLKEKGQECFVPLLKKNRLWAKRTVSVDLPLIPGYVFCRSNRFGMLPILTTPGVVDVVRAGSTPVPIPDSEIESLDLAIRASTSIEPCAYVEVGQRVHIHSGPLAGLVGIVCDRRKTRHLILSVSILQRSVLVQIETTETHPVLAGKDADYFARIA